MRIIAGTLGGRLFESPHTNRTHPMSDKIRGALFNVLGSLDGMAVLDAFAGSGAVGFEAISRGASQATLIEIDKDAYRTIQDNIKILNVEDRVLAIRGNIKSWASNNRARMYDVVICDPPYDAVLENLIFKISRLTADNGILVLSWPISEPIPDVPEMHIARHKAYGNATLVFYKRIK